ncbi:ABC transporter ATP-binding protein [Salibacterium aidingense]|uniref:ABC transporter ATP-binding protein n=1 Tax=Salibacterium aidingense TaxID=384933 RepID=UPI003BBCA74C
MESAICLRHVNKTVQSFDILSDVSMHVKKGEIYGFLGPNGSGKTTVMKIMLHLLKPTSGDIELFGEPLSLRSFHLFSRIGSIIEYPHFYENHSGLDNLNIHCAYMNMDKKDGTEVLKQTGLFRHQHQHVHTYSLGLRQRLGLARAIVTNPDLLILDEPFNGLDPAGVEEMMELLKTINHQNGVTVLVSSHVLTQIEKIADQIGVIKEGKLVSEMSMKDIHSNQGRYTSLEEYFLDLTKKEGFPCLN